MECVVGPVSLFAICDADDPSVVPEVGETRVPFPLALNLTASNRRLDDLEHPYNNS